MTDWWEIDGQFPRIEPQMLTFSRAVNLTVSVDSNGFPHRNFIGLCCVSETPGFDSAEGAIYGFNDNWYYYATCTIEFDYEDYIGD